MYSNDKETSVHTASLSRLGVEAFGDPFQVTIENHAIEDENEQRFAMIAMTESMVLLFIVFTDRSSDDRETLHIISARKAERYEEKIYSAHLKNQNQ